MHYSNIDSHDISSIIHLNRSTSKYFRQIIRNPIIEILVFISSILFSSMQYDSKEELFAALNQEHRQNGYTLTIARSDLKQGTLTLKCDRGGVYRSRRNPADSDLIARRNTGTRLCDCKYSIKCRSTAEGKWIAGESIYQHNHQPSQDMSGHLSVRRLTEDSSQIISVLSTSGSAPKHIISALRITEPTQVVIRKDVYNARGKMRREVLAGRTPIQALLDDLHSANFQVHYQQDNDGCVSHLIFAHENSVQLTRRFHNVMIIDSTYKTNRFKMPLMSIVGVTCANSTFFSAFAFLRREQDEDYLWAMTKFKLMIGGVTPRVFVTDCEVALMNALSRCFPESPNLLCIWHINKNVLAKSKTLLQSSEESEHCVQLWSMLTYSSTVEEFEESWRALGIFGIESRLFQYLAGQWIPHKE